MAFSNKFRNSMNTRLTKGLFYELSEDHTQDVYTLKDQDHLVGEKLYPSLYRLYMEAEDLLEYNFANTHLDGWEHWTMITGATWFKPYLDRWRKELELKVRSDALQRLREDALSNSKSAQLSNRFLLERGWDLEVGKGRGRPSKAEIKQAAKEAAEQKTTFEADYNRLVGLSGSPLEANTNNGRQSQSN